MRHRVATLAPGADGVCAPALVGDPSKIRERLGWEPQVRFGDLARMMVDADVEALRAQTAGEAR
jgi:hypothetical protein